MLTGSNMALQAQLFGITNRCSPRYLLKRTRFMLVINFANVHMSGVHGLLELSVG